jgi:hypothetical protein
LRNITEKRWSVLQGFSNIPFNAELLEKETQELKKKLSSLDATNDETIKKLKTQNNSGSGSGNSLTRKISVPKASCIQGLDRPLSAQGDLPLGGNFTNRAQGWMNQFFNTSKPKNIDLKIPHDLKIDVN